MSTFELCDESGDTGMFVAGLDIDITFRAEADKAGRPDERLLTVTHPEDLLSQDALRLAARGVRNRAVSHSVSTLADPNR